MSGSIACPDSSFSAGRIAYVRQHIRIDYVEVGVALGYRTTGTRPPSEIKAMKLSSPSSQSRAGSSFHSSRSSFTFAGPLIAQNVYAFMLHDKHISQILSSLCFFSPTVLSCRMCMSTKDFWLYS